MLKLSDLTLRPDIQLGPMLVSPSRRLIEGPGGYTHVEPLIMQVFLLLLDSRGRVVSRSELFDECWGGVYVGDDSLNRAILKVRRTGAQVAPGLYEIETIPRTGYRLTGDILDCLGNNATGAGMSHDKPGLSRRQLASGAVGALALAGIGGWAAIRSRQNTRFDALIEHAEAAIRTEDANKEIIRSLEKAVAMRPGSAKAWGMLAFFNAILAQLSEPKDAEPLIGHAQDSARRAFSINPNEPNALLAMFELEGSTLDWFTRDRRLRRIIAIDPTRVWAIAELVLMLQAAGMNRESRYWNERAIALVPLSLDFLGKRAFKLWIAGRVPEADKVSDQLRALYPTNDWAWYVRFLIYATTGRALAAQTMFESNPRMIPDPKEAAMWRASLTALIDPSAATIAKARAVCIDGAKSVDQVRGQAVMILSALGDLDAAFEIAEGYLLGRGPIIRREQPNSNAPVQDAVGRINMQWLFCPPCAAMRRDPRFGPMCDEIGLTEYWRRRGVQPDYRNLER